MRTTVEDAAEGYAKQGWRVFPVGRDKRPLTAHGFKDATTNLDIVKYWWGERHPGASIGLAIPEDILIVDVDPRNGGPIHVEALGLPETSMASTPSGGWHLYFNVPEGSGPFVGKFPRISGVDIKAPGKGYVILPPSPGYTWVTGGGFAKLEGLQLEMLTRKNIVTDALRTGPKAFLPWETGTGPGLNYLAKALQTMRDAREGDRNNTLFRVTMSVLSIIEQGDLSEDAAMPQLRDAALATGLEDYEVRQAMLSAYERRDA